MPEPLPRQSGLTTLGWACYLACSWTWCIGMFLPVLLVRDFGLWGFVVFAVPNVIGAAAMGWMLKRRGSSEALVGQNRVACVAFSWVTVLFHVFFVTWMATGRFPSAGPVTSRANEWLLLGIPAAVLLSWPAIRARVSLLPGLVFYAVAIGAAAVAWGVQTFHFPDPAVIPPGELARLGSGHNALWLAPVCVFGFLLCPYLDLTFHKSRQHTTPDAGVSAFLIGFGVLFWFMILFTLGYAGWFLRYPDRSFLSIGLCAVIVHILVQCTFTVMLHVAEALRALRARQAAALAAAIAAVVVAVVTWKMTNVDQRLQQDHGQTLSRGELFYRCFISFYGLVFPTYVWLCMVPTRDGHSGTAGPQGRRKIIVWAVAVALAAPPFWMGFIERQTWWLAPGLGAILLARLLVPGGRGFGRLRIDESAEPTSASPSASGAA